MDDESDKKFVYCLYSLFLISISFNFVFFYFYRESVFYTYLLLIFSVISCSSVIIYGISDQFPIENPEPIRKTLAYILGYSGNSIMFLILNTILSMNSFPLELGILGLISGTANFLIFVVLYYFGKIIGQLVLKLKKKNIV